MAESKGKYQPWNHEAFMSDPRVRRMTPLAAKTYMMLLHEVFVCSTRPNLPDDDEELELLAFCADHEEWESIKDAVLKMFSRDVIDGVPVLTNRRLTKDWEHLTARYWFAHRTALARLRVWLVGDPLVGRVYNKYRR